MYTSIFAFLRKHTRYLIIITIIVAPIAYYFYTKSDSTDTASVYTVVDVVERGIVSSGIHTSGEVIAAQKLDLDVYKQLSRIDVVNIVNGGHVKKGDILISFDKSDAFVDAESARVALAEAELSLKESNENASDPNTEIRSLEDKIEIYKKDIVDATQDIYDAYRNFLNEDIEVVPQESDEDRLASRTRPTLGGRYIGDVEGEYVIEVYGSGASSGYSFRLSGIESYIGTVYLGTAVDLGADGLTIIFPTTTRIGDTWVVRVPNTTTATYEETKREYENTVADLKKQIETTKVTLTNAEQELEDLKNTDTSEYRDLNVEKARITVSSAQEKLSQNYDVIHERNIVAPFSGTIQDMENVVVGATPTGGSEDAINLGTLISDEFLTTFTLSATDVTKVSVGQKVNVTITSLSEQPVFEGEVSEISSLPASSGVAQYEVLAKLNYDPKTARVVLREGVLADIEIVQEEKNDALRIPISAVTYIEGRPTVQVIDTLTDTQRQEVEQLGIIKTTGTASLPAYTKTVTLGIYGTYYTEVIDGLSEGEYILTTAIADVTQGSVVEQEGFGQGRGGQRQPPSGDANTSKE